MSAFFRSVCVPSKVPFLINTYLKSMRKEFLVLEFYASSFVFSLVVTFITVGIWLNLNAAFFLSFCPARSSVCWQSIM